MYGVVDLDVASAGFGADFGLPVSEGGAHPDGTRNRIIECTDGTYVELLVVDVPTSPEASWLREQIRGGRRFLGWGVVVDDLEEVSARLGVPAVPGSIERPDGTVGRWRIVGVAETMADLSLPFFIEYDRPRGETRPVPALAGSPDGIAWTEVAGDADRLRRWLGGTHPSVRVVEVGDAGPGIAAVALRRGGEELVLR